METSTPAMNGTDVLRTEWWIIGGMLIDEEAAEKAAGALEPEAFRDVRNEELFRAMVRLNDSGHTIDPTTVLGELGRTDRLEMVGEDYLTDLLDAVPTAANIDYHLERLQEEHQREQLRGLGRAVQLAADQESLAPDELRQLEQELHGLLNGASPEHSDGLRSAQEILEDPEARRRPPTAADLLVWRGLVTLLVSQPKDGKSTLLRWAVARRSQGLGVWRNEEAVDGSLRTLYLGEERPVDIASDLYSMGADLDRVHVRDMRRHPGDRLSMLEYDVEAVQPDIIVIDTLSTYIATIEMDPWKSTAWGPVLNPISAVAQGVNAGVLIIHHARKSDGRARDSGAIEASVDVILEMGRDPDEGDNVRRVKSRARSAAPSKGFKYLFTDHGAPHLELLDGSLSLEERVQEFVRKNPGCSQRDARKGVRGRDKDIKEALEKLSGPGGPVVCDDSATPYRYSLR